MIERFEVGQKLVLSRNNKNRYFAKSRDEVFIVSELWDERHYTNKEEWTDGVLKNEDGKKIYQGMINIHDFDYYGVHVNNEILDIVNRHQVKSFQAILDDGRIIHLSCLN